MSRTPTFSRIPSALRSRLAVLSVVLGTLGLIMVSGLLVAACSSSWDDQLAEWKKSHRRCPDTNYRVPCEYGPDGGLYKKKNK